MRNLATSIHPSQYACSQRKVPGRWARARRAGLAGHSMADWAAGCPLCLPELALDGDGAGRRFKGAPHDRRPRPARGAEPHAGDAAAIRAPRPRATPATAFGARAAGADSAKARRAALSHQRLDAAAPAGGNHAGRRLRPARAQARHAVQWSRFDDAWHSRAGRCAGRPAAARAPSRPATAPLTAPPIHPSTGYPPCRRSWRG